MHYERRQKGGNPKYDAFLLICSPIYPDLLEKRSIGSQKMENRGQPLYITYTGWVSLYHNYVQYFMNIFKWTEECLALLIVAPALSPTRARCPPNLSSPHPHCSGNSSLPVPRSPSAPRPLLAWASQAPRSLVAAFTALATPTLPPCRAFRPPCMWSERGGHQTTADSSIPPLSGHPPPPTPNPPLRSPRRRR